MSPWRILLIVAPCLVTVAWLRVVFGGYMNYGWPIMASGAHILVGVMLLIGNAFGLVRMSFALLVLAAPILHIVGFAFERPWRELLFAAPSVAIFVATWLELRTQRS